MNRLRRLSPRAGATLVEIAISTTILTAVLVVAAATALRTQVAWADANARNDVERRASSALARILDLLEDVPPSAIADDLSPAAAASSLTFRKKSGWASDAVTLGPLTTLAWESDATDPANGKDDDRDGLVDEGFVSLTIDDGGTVSRAEIATGVTALLQGETANGADENGNGIADERGLSIVRMGDRILVRLTLSRRGADGTRLVRTIEGAVSARE